jgi:hypothetical protein
VPDQVNLAGSSIAPLSLSCPIDTDEIGVLVEVHLKIAVEGVVNRSPNPSWQVHIGGGGGVAISHFDVKIAYASVMARA